MRRGRPTKAEDAQLVYELEVQGQVVRHRNRALIGYLAGDKEYTLPGSNWRVVRYDADKRTVVLVGLIHPSGLREQYGYFSIDSGAARFEPKEGA